MLRRRAMISLLNQLFRTPEGSPLPLHHTQPNPHPPRPPSLPPPAINNGLVVTCDPLSNKAIQDPGMHVGLPGTVLDTLGPLVVVHELP